jgi:2,3-bisphosphoglycerate-independent phosphoglycerate mutase
MDRDKRWDRVERAYDALARGRGAVARSAVDAIEEAYKNDVTDEFLEPTVLRAYEGMLDGDGVLMANFRADRAREILTALVDPEFDGFDRQKIIAASCVVGMVEYSAALAPFMTALFPPQHVDNSLGEIVAAAGLKQLRIAETEKYAHVTFFFNGGSEAVFEGEDRILIPSPKVATYDLKPEMAAAEVTDRLIAAIGGGMYDLIIVNYANPDMVGHTGDFAAALSAVETIDTCLSGLCKAVESAEGVLLITADHGNIEHMHDLESDQPYTAHTTNRVPVMLAVAPSCIPAVELKDGRLADVAPTLLRFLGLPQPKEMTGHDLTFPAASASDLAQPGSRATTG